MRSKAESRGYRNNNPGNIERNNDVFQGEVISHDKRFKQFQSMAYGYRAMFVNLDTYRRRGINTIEKIIKAWAPAVENHTETYIETVSKRSGVPRDQVLTDHNGVNYVNIVAAMSFVENGVEPDMGDILSGFSLQNRIK